MLITSVLSSVLPMYLGRQGSLSLVFKHWLSRHSNYRDTERFQVCNFRRWGFNSCQFFPLPCPVLQAFVLRMQLSSGRQHTDHWSNPVESIPTVLLGDLFLTWPDLSHSVYSMISLRVAPVQPAHCSPKWEWMGRPSNALPVTASKIPMPMNSGLAVWQSLHQRLSKAATSIFHYYTWTGMIHS